MHLLLFIITYYNSLFLKYELASVIGIDFSKVVSDEGRNLNLALTWENLNVAVFHESMICTQNKKSSYFHEKNLKKDKLYHMGDKSYRYRDFLQIIKMPTHAANTSTAMMADV